MSPSSATVAAFASAGPTPHDCVNSSAADYCPLAQTLRRCVRQRLEILVHVGDHHAAFADAGRDAFDRVAAHVARGEDAGDVGLECERAALLRPRLEAAPGQEEAARVALESRRAPAALRGGA